MNNPIKTPVGQLQRFFPLIGLRRYVAGGAQIVKGRPNERTAFDRFD